MSAKPDIKDQKSNRILWQQEILQGTSHYYSELASDGRLRELWEQFFEKLPQNNGAEYLDDKRTELAKQIKDNGITYNVYADQLGGAARPWSLDLLPLIINQKDWAQLSAGVAQRAKLLNLMMVDAYGEQKITKKGLLPTDIVQGHPGFLPQMMGVKPPGNVWLHRVAFDLGRSPDGRWWIISHRLQAPSGLGYSLENRICISKSFNRSFRDLGVQHLARFFRDYVDAVRKLSPKKENTRIALLTPGPYNETYFEHTYLARYLGISLVEGGDLVVRQNKVYLKTIHGLEQIDALIRRTDDKWLDPLELREDSFLGVPGLLQALRVNGVVLLNMPGNSWMESPALHGFLPGLSKTLLGEELLIPSVPSWWCGESPAWAQASERLENLVIKSTYPNQFGNSIEPVMGSMLGESEKRKWLSTISRKPAQFTLQELIPLSRAPIWTERGLEERAMMLRLFAVTDGEGNYKVMPGGLTRVAGDQHGIVSMQKGGSSLDTWVCSSEPVDNTSNLKGRLQAGDLAALKRPVSSRAAEHLFWLGRYTERASYTLRLLARAQMLLKEDEFLDPNTLSFLYEMCGKQGLSDEFNPSDPGNQDKLEAELIERFWFVNDPKLPPPVGLGGQLTALARVAGQLRDRLSMGHWRLLNEASKLLIKRKDAGGELLRRAQDQAQDMSSIPEATLEHVRLYLMAMHGEQSDHMTRDDGWRFLQLGRQLERLYGACECLLSMTSMPGRANENGIALGIALADSTITYRSRYQHRFEWLPALDLLIFDLDNPYSIKRILYKINIELNRLPGDHSAIRQLFDQVFTDGKMPKGLSLEALQPPFPVETSQLLRQWLKDLLSMSMKLSDVVGAQYFRLAELPDQMIQGR